jgi:poly-gamma-glutamate synthesis protein (capsule biosynthesis protein)
LDGISILISGDIVPTRTNNDLFVKGDLDRLIGRNLSKVLNKSDFRIFNLEAPLSDKETPIAKHGPNLRAPTNTIKGIKAMNPSLINLANNHIMDHDKQGLLSTIHFLNNNNIHTIGAGRNGKEASKPFIIEKEGIRVGIYACADHEFSIATKEKMGANPFDPLESMDHINELKKMCNYVIVLYHGGKEQYRYPSPYLQKVCRKMVEKGADFVVCQHSHCIGCFEKYRNSTICYGQGNFIFDGSESEFWKTGLLIELLIDKSQVKINYLPIVKSNNTVRLADKKMLQIILDSFMERSLQILQPNLIEKEYEKFAYSKLDDYLKTFHGGNYLYKIGNKVGNKIANKIGMNKLIKIYSKKQLLAIRNYIECDAHRELLINGLNIRLEGGNRVK